METVIAEWLNKGCISIEEYNKLTGNVKPPLGLTPREIWEQTRLNNITHAILRYLKANKPIPREWIEEYNELLK